MSQVERAVQLYDDPADMDKQMAFEVWTLQADRSPTRTATILEKDHGITISRDLISRWSKRHNWASHAVQLMGASQPTLQEQTIASIMQGSADGAAYLHQVIRGDIEPDKNRVVASFGMMDRAGFLPHTRKDAERGATPMHRAPSANDTDVYAVASDDELRAAIAGRITGT